jgi:uncharacterized membrane protein
MEDPQSRIEAARASGKPLHVEVTAPLTQEDRKILNRSRSEQIFMYVVFIVLLTGFPFLPFEDAVFEYQVGASVGLFLLITTLVTITIRKMNAAHRTIPKTIVRGIVTNKVMERGKQATHYELTVGDSTPLDVTAGQYHSYQIGDGVEIHSWSGWGSFVLSVKRWEG